MDATKQGPNTASAGGIALIIAATLEILGASSRSGPEYDRSAELTRAAHELRALASSDGDSQQVREKGLAALELATREVQAARVELARDSGRDAKVRRGEGASARAGMIREGLPITPYGEGEITHAEVNKQSEALLGDLLVLRDLLTSL